MNYSAFRRTGAVRPAVELRSNFDGEPSWPNIRIADITRESTAGLTASLFYTSLCCSLPSGLSRRERQLAGYTRMLQNAFPEQLRLSVGPVPAGARLAGYARANQSLLPPGQARRKRNFLRAMVANQL